MEIPTRDQVDEFADALRDSILKVLDDHGWIVGQLGNESAGYCSMGAWYKATNLRSTTYTDAPLTKAFREAYVKAARDLYPLDEITSVETFNDRIAKSPEDIRLVMKHSTNFLADKIEETYKLLAEMQAATDEKPEAEAS